MCPKLKSGLFNWCLVLCLLNLGTLDDSSTWPLRSLMFYPNAEGVTAEMELRGDGNSPGNIEIKCGSNFSWTPTAELNLTGEVMNVNASGLLPEGSHAVCLMNNIPFLNLSVPCLYRDGVPKPLITGLSAIKNGENTCLSIEWGLNANSFQVDHWEINCVDQLNSTSMILNSTVAYKAELCYQPSSEWAYCCVVVNLMLNDSSFRSCDCQHISLAQPPQPQANVYGITAQKINNSICIEFHWEFTGHQVITAGVCCTPEHLLSHQTCHKEDVPCHLKRMTSSWCGTYGQGNYQLYCYAFNEFNTDEGIRTVKSRIYSSPIDDPKLQDISYAFHSQKNQRCFVVHYFIPKSFYSLQEVSLCCGTNHCQNQTIDTMANVNNWEERMNITHCESSSISDLSMECELKYIFYPNTMFSKSVSITEPVKVQVEGFLLADRSRGWKENGNEDGLRESCFQLKLIVTGKLDNKSVSECCAKSVSSDESCVTKGNLLCIQSHKIEPTAYCYAKVNGNPPEISNIIEKNLVKPRMHNITIESVGNLRTYSPYFIKNYLDINGHTNSKMAVTDMKTSFELTNGSIGYDSPEETYMIINPRIEQSEQDQQIQLTLQLGLDYSGTYYNATYLIPEYQSLSNITVEKTYYHNELCIEFTWENIKTPPSYFPAQINQVSYAVIICTGCSNISERVNIYGRINSNPYSEARTCISNVNACNCKLECSIEVRYEDSLYWLVAIGRSDGIVVEPTCKGLKNVHLASANLSCVEVSWQFELDEEVEHFQVICSNSALQYNVTNMTTQVCGLGYDTAVNCTVSAMFADGESTKGFSNTIVTPCYRPGRVEKIDAAPEFCVDQSGDLIAVIWNITWQAGLPNCQSIGYNVTIEEKGQNYSSETCSSWLTFRSSVVNERFSVAVFATSNEGLSGENFQDSFIYKESQPPTPIVNFTSINASCALFTIKYPLTEHPVARYIDVDCMVNEHNEAVINLTLKNLDNASIPVCKLHTTGTLLCSAAYKNFAGVSSRAIAEYNIYAASSTTEHGSSTKPYTNAKSESALSSTEYNELHDSTEDFTIESDQTTIENLKNEISANYPSKTPLIKAPIATLQKVMESTSGENTVKTDLGSTSQLARTMTMFTAEVYSTSPLAQTTEKIEDNPEKLENISSKTNSTLPLILLSICFWLL